MSRAHWSCSVQNRSHLLVRATGRLVPHRPVVLLQLQLQLLYPLVVVAVVLRLLLVAGSLLELQQRAVCSPGVFFVGLYDGDLDLVGDAGG